MFDHFFEFLTWSRQNLLAALAVIAVGAFLVVAYEVSAVLVPALTSGYLADRTQFKTAIAGYAVLDTKLNDIRLRYNASRAGLFRFHNGSRDVRGVAFYFASVATMVGVEVDLKSVTDLNASVFAPIYPSLTQNKPVCFATKAMTEGPLRDLEHLRGVVYDCYFPIFDLANNLAGFMTLGWLDASAVPPEKDRFAMLADVQAEASKLSGYFLWTSGQK